ncbi:MAG: LPS export ABC transporter periplasmic protein LptC [Muribaculaceae bacterium]|nr:LPS export ABC transporter periplasmic protein LptC [Muribaculaceae bacterium]
MATALSIAGLSVVGCNDEKSTDVVHRETDSEIVPTMMTRDVETMISDSGITRYRITTPMWLVFEDAKEPRWSFPEGMYLEKFDMQFRSDASIICDSATYFSNKKLWRLDGNVNISNVQNEKFLTQQIFWDQRSKKVYSDSFIHIEKSDRIIEGYGFISNESMTNYTINKPSGIFPMSDMHKSKTDSTATYDLQSDTTMLKDSTSTPTTRQSRRPAITRPKITGNTKNLSPRR